MGFTKKGEEGMGKIESGKKGEPLKKSFNVPSSRISCIKILVLLPDPFVHGCSLSLC